MSIEIRTTNRGFPIADFKDYYGEPCSIQISSLADTRCIFLGLDNPTPKVLVRGEGWKNVDLPEGTFTNGRMHLSMEQVRELLPLLQAFAETGELSDDDRQEEAR